MSTITSLAVIAAMIPLDTSPSFISFKVLAYNSSINDLSAFMDLKPSFFTGILCAIFVLMPDTRRSSSQSLTIMPKRCQMSIKFFYKRNYTDKNRLKSVIGWILIINGVKPGAFCNCSSMAGVRLNLMPALSFQPPALSFPFTSLSFPRKRESI